MRRLWGKGEEAVSMGKAMGGKSRSFVLGKAVVS